MPERTPRAAGKNAGLGALVQPAELFRRLGREAAAAAPVLCVQLVRCIAEDITRLGSAAPAIGLILAVGRSALAVALVPLRESGSLSALQD